MVAILGLALGLGPAEPRGCLGLGLAWVTRICVWAHGLVKNSNCFIFQLFLAMSATAVVIPFAMESTPSSPVTPRTVVTAERELPENIKKKHAEVKRRRQGRQRPVLVAPTSVPKVKKYPALSAERAKVMEQRATERRAFAVSAKVPEEFQPEFERAVKQVMQYACNTHSHLKRAVKRYHYYADKLAKAMTLVSRRRKERSAILLKQSDRLSLKYRAFLTTCDHAEHAVDTPDAICLECAVNTSVSTPPGRGIPMDTVTVTAKDDDDVSSSSGDEASDYGEEPVEDVVSEADTLASSDSEPETTATQSL